MDSSSDSLNAVELLADEFMERQRKGEGPTIEEYVARHPDLAADIRDVFPALVMMERVAPANADLFQSEAPARSDGRVALDHVGDYRIIREIGRGGMGVVYEAEQESLRRRVALKVLPRPHATDGRSLERFQREARAAARMHHTNIVPVFEVGEDDDWVFYAMQLIQGQCLDLVVDDLKRLRSEHSKIAAASPANSGEAHSIAASLMAGRFEQENLAELAREEPRDDSSLVAQRSTADRDVAYAETVKAGLDAPTSAVLPGKSELSSAETDRKGYFESVAQIGLQAANALAYAHARGIIHRDIKPSNLLLDAAGVVWVTDFGLAKTSDEAITHTGDILGTIRYMSPERFKGECDVRADIYALGLTLYELLVLKPAFHSPDRLKLIDLVANAEADAPRSLDPRIPRDLETVVLKCIDKTPKRRYQSAEELADDLQRFIADEPIRARRISMIERFARWSRRNKGLAASLSVVATLVLVVAIGSIIAAGYFRQQERVQRELTGEKEVQRVAAVKARKQAETAEALARIAKSDAERKELEARRQHYASDSTSASHAARSGDQYTRLYSYINEWAGESDGFRDWEYYYLQGQIQIPSLEWDYRKHNAGWDHKRAVAWSPDGRRIAVQSGDGGPEVKLAVYDAITGDRIWRTFGEEGIYFDWNTVDWSPDGSQIVTSSRSRGGEIVVLAAATGRILHRFPAPPGRVRWSRSGRWLVSFSGKAGRIWDAKTSKFIRELNGHTSNVVDVAWGPADQRIASCSERGDVRIWNADSGKLLDQWRHPGDVKAWAWSPDGKQMAFATRGTSSVTIRNVDSKLEHTLRDSSFAEVWALAWSPKGGRLAATGGRTRTLWDTQTGKQLDGAAQGEIYALAWSRDGEKLASVGRQGRVQIWSANRTAWPRVIVSATAFAWEPGGRCFLTAQDKKITVWDAWNWSKVRDNLETPGDVTALGLSSDGKMIAAGDNQGTLTVWNGDTGEQLRHIPDLKNVVVDLAFSPDRKWLSAVTGDKFRRQLHLWDTATWQHQSPPVDIIIDGRTRGFHKWSPDSRYVLTGSGNFYWGEWQRKPSYGVWNPRRREWHDFRLNEGSPICAAWHPQAKQFAFAANPDVDADIQLIPVGRDGLPQDRADARFLKSAHSKPVQSLDWSPNGRRIVSVGSEGRARVWDVDSLLQVCEIPDARFARWGPFGVRLAVLTSRGVEIHDASIGAARGRWKQLLPLFERKRQLGRLTTDDLLTKAEIHVHHQQWDEAFKTIADLRKLSPTDPRVLMLAARTTERYAGLRFIHERAGLGVRFRKHTRRPVDTENAEKQTGLQLTVIVSKSPAEKSGLRHGDFVISVNGVRVESWSRLDSMLSEIIPGSTVEFELYRDRRLMRIPVKADRVGQNLGRQRFVSVPANKIGRTIDGRYDARRYVEQARDIYSRLCELEPNHPGYTRRLMTIKSLLAAGRSLTR